MAFTFPWLLVSCVGNVVLAYDLHVGQILLGGGELEEIMAPVCAEQTVEDPLVGPVACAAEVSAVAAGTLAAVTVDLGLWAGLSFISEVSSYPDMELKTRTVEKAPAALLKAMNKQLHLMKEAFDDMQSNLVDMTKKVNEEKWGDVAAAADLVLGSGEKFALAMSLALKQGGCETAIQPVTCLDHYYICTPIDGDSCTSDGCLAEPMDCYDQCCQEQRDWCQDDYPCLHQRGCADDQTHPKSFGEQNCDLLEKTDGDFEQAKVDVKALHDCAAVLKEGRMVAGCSKETEQRVAQQIKEHMKLVKKDLDSLTDLYQASAAPDALVAKASSATEAQNKLARVCDEAFKSVPTCSALLTAIPGHGNDNGSAKLQDLLPLVSMGLLMVYFFALIRHHNNRKEYLPTRQPLQQHLITDDNMVEGDDSTGWMGNWRAIGALVLFLIVLFQAYPAYRSYQAWRQVVLRSDTKPLRTSTAAPLAPDCLQTEYVMEQIFGTCSDVKSILKAANEKGESANDTLTDVVGKLASDFQKLVRVALNH